MLLATGVWVSLGMAFVLYLTEASLCLWKIFGKRDEETEANVESAQMAIFSAFLAVHVLHLCCHYRGNTGADGDPEHEPGLRLLWDRHSLMTLLCFAFTMIMIIVECSEGSSTPLQACVTIAFYTSVMLYWHIKTASLMTPDLKRKVRLAMVVAHCFTCIVVFVHTVYDESGMLFTDNNVSYLRSIGETILLVELIHLAIKKHQLIEGEDDAAIEGGALLHVNGVAYGAVDRAMEHDNQV